MSSIHSSANTMPLQGFTIFQSTLGATLQFEPALQTPELDAMIDAYVAGTDSIQQKRAAVCVEFFSYAAQTGQTNDLQLFFPVFPKTFGNESSASLGDSSCGSGFDVSPVVPDMTWDSFSMATPTTPATPATPSSAFAAPSQNRVTKSKAAGSARKAGSRASAATAHDFSHIPGMKILTKDGVDVTSSASRGSKTKAMREHAHLIRLLKACESCKKKKVRCDPSHKRRAAGQAPAAVEAAKSKKSKSASPPVTPQAETATQEASFQVASLETTPFDAQLESLDSFDWEKCMQPEADIFSLPIDYNYTLDARGFLTPSSGSSGSPAQPFTPAPAVGYNSFEAPHSFAAGALAVQAPVQQPQLPYLHNDGHTSEYVDFTLYSPASSFLDEEPRELQSAGPSPSSAFISWSSEPATTGHERIEHHEERAEQRQPHQRARCASPSTAFDSRASHADRPVHVLGRDDLEYHGGALEHRVANPDSSHLSAAHNSPSRQVSSSIGTTSSLVAAVATAHEPSCGQDLYGGGRGGGGADGQSQQQQQSSPEAFTAHTPSDNSRRDRKTVPVKKTLSPGQQSWSSSVSSDTESVDLSQSLALGAPQAARSFVDGGLSGINAGSITDGSLLASRRNNSLVSDVTVIPVAAVTSSQGVSRNSTVMTTSSGASAVRSTSKLSSSVQLESTSSSMSAVSPGIPVSQSPSIFATTSVGRVCANKATVITRPDDVRTAESAPIAVAVHHTRTSLSKPTVVGLETPSQPSSTAPSPTRSPSQLRDASPRGAPSAAPLYWAQATGTNGLLSQHLKSAPKEPVVGLALAPQPRASRIPGYAPQHAPGPQSVLNATALKPLSVSRTSLHPQPQKGLSGTAQSWAPLALVGLVLVMQAQDAVSGLLSILVLSTVSAVLQQFNSLPLPSSRLSQPQCARSWHAPEEAMEFGKPKGSGNSPLAQLDGLRSAASRRVSLCLGQWTATCGC